MCGARDRGHVRGRERGGSGRAIGPGLRLVNWGQGQGQGQGWGASTPKSFSRSWLVMPNGIKSGRCSRQNSKSDRTRRILDQTIHTQIHYTAYIGEHRSICRSVSEP